MSIIIITEAMRVASIKTVQLATSIVENKGWITMNDGWAHIAKKAMYSTEDRVTPEQWKCCFDVAELAIQLADKQGILHHIQNDSQENIKNHKDCPKCPDCGGTSEEECFEAYEYYQCSKCGNRFQDKDIV